MIPSQEKLPADYMLVPATEISARVTTFQQRLSEADLDGAVILDGVNLFYFAGTRQQGLLFIPQRGRPVFFVRRSLERARQESPLESLMPVARFEEIPPWIAGAGYGTSKLGLSYTAVPLSIYRKLQSIFPHTEFQDVGPTLAMVRAVKSAYEVALMREAGTRHGQIFAEIPGLVSPGMTEWQLGSAIHGEMLKRGFTGLMRLAAFNSELFAGVVSFGDSGNYPTASVGPDGLLGLGAAFPLLGGSRSLHHGEIIFVDSGFSYGGYYTDMTRIFCLGRPPEVALDAHDICLEVQEAVRERLKPGAVPGEIYEEVYDTLIRGQIRGPIRGRILGRGAEENFMGYGSNQVPFLGHGIGLEVDEFPAIAKKIRVPLEKNMVVAVEPKKGLAGVGLVGIENTFLVTDQGGEKLTIGKDDIVALS